MVPQVEEERGALRGSVLSPSIWLRGGLVQSRPETGRSQSRPRWTEEERAGAVKLSLSYPLEPPGALWKTIPSVARLHPRPVLPISDCETQWLFKAPWAPVCGHTGEALGGSGRDHSTIVALTIALVPSFTTLVYELKTFMEHLCQQLFWVLTMFLI